MLPPHSNFWQRHRRLVAAVLPIGVLAILYLGGFLAFFLVSVPSFYLDAIIYASLFGLMAMGLTLTYLTTKVPNFAYGSFVTVGMYVSYTFNILYKVSAYVSAPAAFLFGGCCSVAMYLI